MVIHVVMIRFREGEGREEAIARSREMIDGLMGKVPTLLSMETGVNFAEEERAMDLCLIARFADRKGLEEYAVHPAHREVLAYLKGVVDYTKVVDYETGAA